MIYQFRKYKDVDAFVNNKPKTTIDENYSILFTCEGFDYQNGSFTNKCFGCLFCTLGDPNILQKFNIYWGVDFIKSYADNAFSGYPINLPNARQSIRNPYKNLESFTGVKETRNIQPWASGIVNHMCTKSNRISMEVPVYNMDYDRNGRLDICSMTDTDLLVMESKISLDDALRDERFIEQSRKYIEEIKKSTKNYMYLTLFGGNETDLFPESSQYCTSRIGKKSERFYLHVINNKIPFMSATALWCLCCRYLTYGKDYSWDIFLKQIFSDPNCIGLLSAGKVKNNNGTISITSF